MTRTKNGARRASKRRAVVDQRKAVAEKQKVYDQPVAVAKKKKPYKIVLEAVTQEKKKLHSILTYASNAPKGFGFIPAGHPEFTEWCKEQCRQRNLDVHIVSAKPKNKMHADPEKLSHHVHRVGHHFPLEIINLACSKFGYTYDEAQGLQKDKSRDRTNWIAQGIEDYSSRQQLQGQPSTENESKEHTRGAVREMFPKIPEADLNSIVNHAFEEGTNRVGNAKELSLARRVQLAVVAHIRHVYTDYDKMLKAGSWMQARQSVEHVSLAKLKEWRDEAGEASNEIEDTFREVIVLDDDSDESSEAGSSATPDEREQSMEIVSSRATARDLQPERYADPRMHVQAMRTAPGGSIVAHLYHDQHSASLPAPSHQQPRYYAPVSDTRPPSRDQLFAPAHSQPVEARTRPPGPHTVPRRAPLVQEIDGQFYHLEPIRESPPPPPTRGYSTLYGAPRHAQDEYVHAAHTTNAPAARRPVPSRRPSEQDVVLPSVEREALDLTSSRHNATQQSVHSESRPFGEYTTLSQKRRSFPYFTDDGEHFESDHKRARPLYTNDMAPRAEPAHLSRLPPPPNHYQTMDSRSRPRAQPAQEYIELTSSPRRAVTNGEYRYHAPPHALPVPDCRRMSYLPDPSHQVPVREEKIQYPAIPSEPPRTFNIGRGVFAGQPPPVRDYSHQIPVREEKIQYQLIPSEPPRAFNIDRGVFAGQPPPVRDYVPLRVEQHQRPVEGTGASYSSRRMQYGGPDLG